MRYNFTTCKLQYRGRQYLTLEHRTRDILHDAAHGALYRSTWHYCKGNFRTAEEFSKFADSLLGTLYRSGRKTC